MDDKHLEALVDEGRAAFEATAAERAAIESPTRTTFDLNAAYQLVGTSLPRIIPFKDQLAALPGFDASSLERVVVCGRAALYALKRERANGPEKSVTHAKLVEEMERLYARFFKTAEYLVAMGLMSAQILTEARTGTSVLARATDLGTLAIEFETHRASLGSNLILGVEEIAAAAKLSNEIADSLVVRTNAERAPSEFRHDRQRAAMVFYAMWEEIRRGVHWVRWYEGDAGTLAPSFFTTADRRVREDDGDDDDVPGDDKRDNGDNGDNNSRGENKPADPLPADKREDLERSKDNAGKGVPQNDPF